MPWIFHIYISIIHFSNTRTYAKWVCVRGKGRDKETGGDNPGLEKKTFFQHHFYINMHTDIWFNFRLNWLRIIIVSLAKAEREREGGKWDLGLVRAAGGGSGVGRQEKVKAKEGGWTAQYNCTRGRWSAIPRPRSRNSPRMTSSSCCSAWRVILSYGKKLR